MLNFIDVDFTGILIETMNSPVFSSTNILVPQFCQDLHKWKQINTFEALVTSFTLRKDDEIERVPKPKQECPHFGSSHIIHKNVSAFFLN